MTDLPQPRAARLRRPSWRDGRLLVGVVLVLASVALGARVIATLDDGTPVYSAAATLPPGRVLAAADLRVVRVRLGSGSAAYLAATAQPPVGAVVLRTVGEGELVPASAVGPPAALTRRPVAIPLTPPVPEGVRPGAAVDVWSSAKETTSAATGFRKPARIAQGATILAVSTDSGQLGASRTVSVQVLLPEAELTAVLDALANGARIALVPGPAAA